MNQRDDTMKIVTSVPETLRKFAGWLRSAKLAESVSAELAALPPVHDASVKVTITFHHDTGNPGKFVANFSTQRVLGVQRCGFRNLTIKDEPAKSG